MTVSSTLESFSRTLSMRGIRLSRKITSILQINVGYLCNQTCRHCHLNAGPDRVEIMTSAVAADVIAFAERNRFSVIDITGGAPELNPNIAFLIKSLAPLTSKLMFRTNLTALTGENMDAFSQMLKSYRTSIIASFPSLNESQTDAQRGRAVFKKSLTALRKLNEIGYGCDGSGLELSLVSNPAGAFLPPSQAQTAKRFREILSKKEGISFNDCYCFANVPLGRFRDWLIESGNYDSYMKKLASSFNPCAVESVMCRSLVSISWDGYLYDCDFNQAEHLYMGGKKIHVSELQGLPEWDAPIAVGNHCYSCTAGSGFT